MMPTEVDVASFFHISYKLFFIKTCSASESVPIVILHEVLASLISSKATLEMPTPLDNAMRSKNLVIAFGGIVTAAAAWSIWGGDMFPAQADPTGNPETWTGEEMRRWLAARNLFPQDNDTRAELLARVLANMRAPRA